MSGKLLVPSGTFSQASGGERFSPTQFGLLCLSAHAFFTASVPLSATEDELSVSTPAARATGAGERVAATNPPISRVAMVRFMTILPLDLDETRDRRDYSAAIGAAKGAATSARSTRGIGCGHQRSSHSLNRPLSRGITRSANSLVL